MPSTTSVRASTPLKLSGYGCANTIKTSTDILFSFDINKLYNTAEERGQSHFFNFMTAGMSTR